MKKCQQPKRLYVIPKQKYVKNQAIGNQHTDYTVTKACQMNHNTEHTYKVKVKSQSQKCFIAIQEKVYIDQNNKTEAHSGLFVPLIWEYHCIILTSFWFNRLVGCKGPADTWHDEVITTFKLHDIFLIQ